MRITLFIGTLGAGGAERALIVLAEGLQKHGHDVTVLTWINQEHDFYHVPEGVKHVRAEIPEDVVSTRWYNAVGIIRRLFALRKSIKTTQPEVVISFLDGNNEMFLLASIKERYIKILSCQIDIAEHDHFNSRWDKLRELIYKWADQIVFLDNEQAERAHQQFPAWNCVGIPNPVVDVSTIPDKQAKEIIDKLKKFPVRLVAMGRLANQKGFDLLLEAFNKVVQHFPQAGLVILGEGPLRDDLQGQIKFLGLTDHVLMPGQTSGPHAVIAACDIFVFSSRYEGQGLALVEAMACGVPAVSFDCPSGPAYIIQDQVDGILVPPEDIDSLAEAVIMLLNDEKKRLEFALAAKKVRDRFSTDRICTRWEYLFHQPES
ncbi:MAG: glycosyltransferase family 4 protein [Arenicellales bacterium]